MRLENVILSIGSGLKRRHPEVYRTARPVFRRSMHTVLRLLGRPDSWDVRRHYEYYKVAYRLARVFVPSGGSVIDVGAFETDLLQKLDWFDRRVAIDRHDIMERRGIETITGDFMEYRPDFTFDLVICLQVLEHLPKPGPFARKLLATGRTVIISVPYKWPRGLYEDHVQDPVDEAKLASWTRRTPDTSEIVEDDGRERLVACYRHQT
jgi:hypothetical protein